MLDISILIIYLFVLFFIGIWIGKDNNSFKEYGQKVGNLKNNSFILLATTFATSVGGGTTFGIVEKVYLEDLGYSYALILSAFADILIGYILVPKLIEYREMMTVADIFEKYYGKFGKFVIGFATIIICVGYLSVQIAVSSKIFQYFFQISDLKSVVFSYAIVVAYTSFGGIKSVIFTDIIQFILMVIAIPIALILGINHFDGEFLSKIPEVKYSLSNNQLVENFIYGSLCFLFTGLNPASIQRALLSKDYKITQNAIIQKSIVYIIFIGIISFIGLAVYLFDSGMSHKLALSHFIDQIIPVGLKGFVLIGFISAAISTADSDLNLATVSIVNDIIKPFFKIKNQELKLKIARIVAIALGIFAIYFSLIFPSVIDIVIFFANFWSPLVFVPLIFILFKKTISHNAFIVLTILVMIVTITFEYNNFTNKIPSMFVGVLLSFMLHTIFILHHNKR
jgi:SSS family solute:Na+ symporter